MLRRYILVQNHQKKNLFFKGKPHSFENVSSLMLYFFYSKSNHFYANQNFPIISPHDTTAKTKHKTLLTGKYLKIEHEINIFDINYSRWIIIRKVLNFFQRLASLSPNRSILRNFLFMALIYYAYLKFFCGNCSLGQ